MKKILFLLFAVSVFTFSCKDDDMQEDGLYDVDISIGSPTEGVSVEIGHVLDIEVKFDRAENATIHNILIEVLDSDNNVIETLEDAHRHTAGTYTFTGTYTTTAAGEFTLRATTTNDANEEPNVQETGFTVTMATYAVTVNVHHPMEGAVKTVNEPMHVHSIFTHDDGGVIHHVTVHIMKNGNVISVLDEGHKHVEGEYVYQEMEAWTPTEPGNYMVHAITRSHDMSIVQEMMRPFTVE